MSGCGQGHETPKGSCQLSFSGQLLAEVEIRMKEGGTSLHKTFEKINVVFKGINCLCSLANLF